ncbi:polysaccharide biosynthesis tyrosine autokinase [Paraburkholderia sediminicola]|uniref:polysaccharide biosynthesis tyrosine autokinase n=1 Tax=Paraburkholderia sediminicola TaxID=458836 RepID=UPI0038BA2DB0
MATNQETTYNGLTSEDDVRLSDYLSIVVESWRLIICTACALLLLGVTYAFLTPPVYRADAMIQVEDNASSAKDALGELASIFDTKATAAAEIELIRSRLVVDSTVQSLHLDVTAVPRYFPIVGELIARHSRGKELASPLFNMKSFAWGGESIKVSQFEVPEDIYDDKFYVRKTSADSYELVKDGEVVLRGKVGTAETGHLENGLIQLQIDSLVARVGTEFQLARHSTRDTVEKLQDDLKIVEKTKESGVIAVSLDGTNTKRVMDTINTIARKYVQQNVDRKSAEAEHTLAFLDQQLPQLRKELDQSEDRYNAFRNKKGTVDLTEESRLLLQQIVDGKTKLLELQQQRDELVQRFTAAHPSVAALNAQIASIDAQQSQLAGRVSALPDTEQAALRLLRDVRVNTTLYTNLLDNAQQLKIVKAGQVGNVRIVDHAVLTEKPIKPQKAVIAALSLVLGLIVGVMAAFLRKSLYGGVEHAEKIEQALGIPVYAVIPHSRTQSRLQQNSRKDVSESRLLAVQMPEDVAIEGLRSLRTALHFGMLDSPNNIVMITGSRPEVGKSFTAANLSAVLAMGGQKVMLVDADMRRGDVHSYFGVSRFPGLSDVISGADIEGTILHNVIPNLDVLPKGTLPPNPAELLMNDRFNLMLEHFASRYDVVIVDTPPVLAVTDSTLIGKLAGTTLLVVRHGYQPLSEISETAKRLRAGGVRLKGVLFTNVPQRRVGYGAYYAGYYGYESSAD